MIQLHHILTFFKSLLHIVHIGFVVSIRKIILITVQLVKL